MCIDILSSCINKVLSREKKSKKKSLTNLYRCDYDSLHWSINTTYKSSLKIMAARNHLKNWYLFLQAWHSTACR